MKLLLKRYQVSIIKQYFLVLSAVSCIFTGTRTAKADDLDEVLSYLITAREAEIEHAREKASVESTPQVTAQNENGAESN